MASQLNVVILAAGKGKRMKSDLPKVLHLLAGKSLLEHCYDTAAQLPSPIIQIIYGHGGEQLLRRLSHLKVTWIEQKQQLGTGHAVQQTLPNIQDNHTVLILYGDVPLLGVDTLKSLVAEVNESTLALLTVIMDDPTGYGRIVRNEHAKVLRIVEHKDASDHEKEITEINTGILAVKGKHLKSWLSRLKPNNAQGEYYLTDIIAMAVSDGVTIATQSPSSVLETIGVNDKQQLSFLERAYQQRQADAVMAAGLTLLDPNRFDLRGNLTFGQDSVIDVNVICEGEVALGSRVSIGANCILRDVTLGDDVVVSAFSHIEQATIGNHCRIGPYARIRPETQLGDYSHIGNFVEIKKAKIGEHSKINHLSYVGDANVGSQVNVGAGTITCNYDGANKHLTVIEDNVFIGSDTQLVAPVTIHQGATIGAGSTITRDVPAQELTLSRVKQTTVKGWKRPKKKL